VTVLIVCIAIVAVSLIVLAILAYGLLGHAARLRRTVATTRAELEQAVAAVQSRAPQGRHRAN
jgi:uncharacterized protein YoxC